MASYLFLSGGAPLPDDPAPDTDVSDDNIRYVFNGNNYKITKESIVTSEGTFTIQEHEVGQYDFKLTSQPSGSTSDFGLSFSPNKDTVFMNGMVGDLYTLQKIQ